MNDLKDMSETELSTLLVNIRCEIKRREVSNKVPTWDKCKDYLLDVSTGEESFDEAVMQRCEQLLKMTHKGKDKTIDAIISLVGELSNDVVDLQRICVMEYDALESMVIIKGNKLQSLIIKLGL